MKKIKLFIDRYFVISLLVLMLLFACVCLFSVKMPSVKAAEGSPYHLTYQYTEDNGNENQPYYEQRAILYSSNPLFIYLHTDMSDRDQGYLYRVGAFDGEKCHAVYKGASYGTTVDYYMRYTMDRKDKSIKSSTGTLVKPELDYLTDATRIQVYSKNGFSSSAYVFDSLESAEAYYLTGNMDGVIKNPDSDDGIYDESLPGVKNLSLSLLSMTECHGINDTYNMCFNLSWDIPEGHMRGDYYTVKLSFKYNYNTYFSLRRKYGSGFEDISNFYSTPIYINSGGLDVCAHDLADNMDLPLNNSLDSVTSFTVENLQKIYIRSARKVGDQVYYGDWYIYTVNKNNSLSPDYNKPDLGEGEVIPGDTEIDPDGNYPDDTEKKDTIPAPDSGNKGGIGGIDFSDLSGIFSTFYSILQNLIGALGSFPALFSAVFMFLPYEIRNSILLIFYIAIIVGIIKIFT